MSRSLTVFAIILLAIVFLLVGCDRDVTPTPVLSQRPTTTPTEGPACVVYETTPPIGWEPGPEKYDIQSGHPEYLTIDGSAIFRFDEFVYRGGFILSAGDVLLTIDLESLISISYTRGTESTLGYIAVSKQNGGNGLAWVSIPDTTGCTIHVEIIANREGPLTSISITEGEKASQEVGVQSQLIHVRPESSKTPTPTVETTCILEEIERPEWFTTEIESILFGQGMWNPYGGNIVNFLVLPHNNVTISIDGTEIEYGQFFDSDINSVHEDEVILFSYGNEVTHFVLTHYEIVWVTANGTCTPTIRLETSQIGDDSYEMNITRAEGSESFQLIELPSTEPTSIPTPASTPVLPAFEVIEGDNLTYYQFDEETWTVNTEDSGVTIRFHAGNQVGDWLPSQELELSEGAYLVEITLNNHIINRPQEVVLTWRDLEVVTQHVVINLEEGQVFLFQDLAAQKNPLIFTVLNDKLFALRFNNPETYAYHGYASLITYLGKTDAGFKLNVLLDNEADVEPIPCWGCLNFVELEIEAQNPSPYMIGPVGCAEVVWVSPNTSLWERPTCE